MIPRTKTLFSFIKFCWGSAKNLAPIALLLNILTAFTEGIGFILLIPLLNLLSDSNNNSNYFVVQITALFEKSGLPLTIEGVLGTFLLVVLLQSYLRYLRTVLNRRIKSLIVKERRGELFKKITYTDWISFTKSKKSDITYALTMQIGEVGYGLNQLLGLITMVILITVDITVAFLISFELTGVTILITCMIMLLLLPGNRRIYKISESLNKKREFIYSIISEHLNSLKLAKGFRKEEEHITSFNRNAAAMLGEEMAFVKTYSGVNMLIEMGSIFLMCTIFFISIKFLGIPFTTLVLLVYIFSRLNPKISNIQRQAHDIINTLPVYESFHVLLSSYKNSTEYVSDNNKDLLFKTELKLEGVSFRYPGEEEDVFNNLTFTIPKGSITGLSGESGAGKSTIVDLILGLIIPTEGIIRVDGRRLNENNILAWRKNISIVLQDPFLFNGTIRENLLWGKADASESELYEALRIAAADELIKKLPAGIHTLLGDNGNNLSGGEKQRLALARAVLRKPELLILDEATASLDKENECKIKEAVAVLRDHMTILVISHKESFLDMCDSVVCLKKREGGEKPVEKIGEKLTLLKFN
jgi:ATP-binding cassette, subfamily C, bacterial